MAAGRILYDNVLTAADTTAITAGTAATAYPLINFYDDNQGSIFKSTGTTQTVVVDYGAAKAIDGVIVLNTNLGASPTTADFEANSSDAWVTPAESENMVGKINPLTNKYDYYLFDIDWNYRYYRFNFEVASGTVDLGLGKIHETNYTFVDDSGVFGNFTRNVEPKGTRQGSLSTHIYNDIIDRRRVYRLWFPKILAAQLAKFDTIGGKNYVTFAPNGTGGIDIMHGVIDFGGFSQQTSDTATTVFYTGSATFDESGP